MYVCSSTLNSQLSVPVFLTNMLVCNSLGLRVTLYVSPNEYGHLALVASSSIESLRPKSIFTLESPDVPGTRELSSVDLPNSSQRVLRAKPCCGSLPVSWDDCGGPKDCDRARLVQSCLEQTRGDRCSDLGGEEGTRGSLTGKTRGMPPLTGLLPSSFALSLRNRFSLPSPVFQLRTVAP